MPSEYQLPLPVVTNDLQESEHVGDNDGDDTTAEEHMARMAALRSALGTSRKEKAKEKGKEKGRGEKEKGKKKGEKNSGSKEEEKKDHKDQPINTEDGGLFSTAHDESEVEDVFDEEDQDEEDEDEDDLLNDSDDDHLGVGYKQQQTVESIGANGGTTISARERLSTTFSDLAQKRMAAPSRAARESANDRDETARRQAARRAKAAKYAAAAAASKKKQEEVDSSSDEEIGRSGIGRKRAWRS